MHTVLERRVRRDRDKTQPKIRILKFKGNSASLTATTPLINTPHNANTMFRFTLLMPGVYSQQQYALTHLCYNTSIGNSHGWTSLFGKLKRARRTANAPTHMSTNHDTLPQAPTS